jgi:mannitol-1-phosphate 5-dehydrogenase
VNVVIVGPGRIGCGYLAPLFVGAGWEVVLAARSELDAARISRAGRFKVRVAASAGGAAERARKDGDGLPAPGTVTELTGIRAVAVGSNRFRRAVAQADLVCVSVGVANVPSLGPQLARALAARSPTRPLDVWVVENAECGGVLEDSVRTSAREEELVLPPVGFAGAVADAVVARGGWGPDEEPVFVGDVHRRLLIDRFHLRGEIPSLPGVVGTLRYPARLREKLYVFNAGHAVCGYLGWLRGHATVDLAVSDPYLRPVIAGTMLESRRALLRAYPELGSDVHGPVAQALARFAAPELSDPVSRVARNPIRKLGPGDRLLGPVRLVRETTGTIPAYFALAVAGALLFRGEGDQEAADLAGMLRTDGVMAVLGAVCGLEEADPFARAVAERYWGFVFTDEGTIFPPAHGPDAIGVGGFEPIAAVR